MANRSFSETYTLGKGVVSIFGNFTVDGAGAVTAQYPTVANAAPFTVTKPAATTGVYRITLQDQFVGVYAVLATVLKAAGANVYKVDGAAADATTRVFDLQVHNTTTGNAADPASLTIGFQLVLKNSTVWP